MMWTAVVLLVVSVAAYFDARWRRVPNWLVAAFLAVSLGWHAVAGIPSLGASAAGFALGLGLLFPLFVVRGLGAGDVKFFAALGAAVTYRQVPVILVLTLVLTAAIALVLVVRGRLLAQTLQNLRTLFWASRPSSPRREQAPSIDRPDAVLVPFTLASAAATWLVLLPPGLR